MAISIDVLVLSDGSKKTSATLRPIRGRSSCAPDLNSDARSRSPSNSSRAKSAVLRKFLSLSSIVIKRSVISSQHSAFSFLPADQSGQFPQSLEEKIDFRAPQRERRQQAQHRRVVGQSGYDSPLEQCFLHRPGSDAFECEA